MNTLVEQKFIDTQRNWILDESSSRSVVNPDEYSKNAVLVRPHVSTLIGYLKYAQMSLDAWEQNPTDQNLEDYENRKHTYFQILNEVGL